MNDRTPPLTGGTTDAREGLARRTVLQGVAWSVPAVAMSSVTPAFATSSAPGVYVTAPNNRVTASGASPVTVRVIDPSGPVAGAGVSLTGPSGSTFAQASGTTDSSGTFATTVDLGKPWTKPGSTATLTAVSGSQNGTAAVTILGANALGWGSLPTSNGTGQSSVRSPTQMMLAFPLPVTQLVTAWDNAAALLADGTVWTLGANSSGQLGDGTTTDRSVFAPVPGLTDVTHISAGWQFFLALLSDGTVRSWGMNNAGQLGNGTLSNSSTPTTVSGLSGVTQVTAAGGTTGNGYALLSDGTVRSWGSSSRGKLGNGTTSSSSPNASDSAVPVTVSNLPQITSIVGGAFGGAAITSGGEVYTWGRGDNGSMGNGSTADSTVPALVPGLAAVTALAGSNASVYALLSDKTVRCWGGNAQGQLGIGNTTTQLTPVAIPNLSDVARISTSVTAFYAMDTSGALKSCGANDLNGDGTYTVRTTVVSVPLPAGVSISRLQNNSLIGRGGALVTATS